MQSPFQTLEKLGWGLKSLILRYFLKLEGMAVNRRRTARRKSLHTKEKLGETGPR